MICSILADLLHDVYFLTNKNFESKAPDLTEQGHDWKLCFHSEAALGDDYTVICTIGSRRRITQSFAVYSAEDHGVGLREVEVYGDGESPAISVLCPFYNTNL